MSKCIIAKKYSHAVVLYGVMAVVLWGMSYVEAFAITAQQICEVPESSVSYQVKSVHSFADTALYGVSVVGVDNLLTATKPIATDFPNNTGVVQFYGFNPLLSLVHGGQTGLVGCLRYTNGEGRKITIANANFDLEGGTPPDVTAMFTVQLGHGIGKVLVLITRIDVELPDLASGDLYNVLFFSAKKAENANSGSGWGELSDLEMMFSPDPYVGFNGSSEGKMRAYPYKTKQEVIQRLKAMGYLK